MICKKICGFEDCFKACSKTKQYCQLHNRRFIKYGDPSNNGKEARSLCKMGSKNPQWKGTGVSYKSLHEWVRLHLIAPKICAVCTTTGRLDAANISGMYLRDLSDWRWLCRSCHMKDDGRLTTLQENKVLYFRNKRMVNNT